MFKPLHLLVSVLFVFTSGFAQAQDFRVTGNGRFAEVDGEIEIGGGERFRDFLARNPAIIGLRLNSPGGVVVSALDMADEIFLRRLGTFIGDDDVCASACAILFFAGYDRLANGGLGVHQMDDGGRGDASSLQFVLAEQIDAFQKFDVPWTIINRMLTTPPREMYWITKDELSEFGLNRDLAGDASDFVEKPHQVPETAPQINFSDYPTPLYTGPVLFPDFEGRDSGYSNYHTRIAEGVSRGVNFSGKYSIIEVGCGTSCRFVFVVNLETGEPIMFPYGGEQNYQMKLLVARQSR